MRQLLSELTMKRSTIITLSMAILVVSASGCTSFGRSFKNSAGVLVLASTHGHRTHNHSHDDHERDERHEEYDDDHYDRPATKHDSSKREIREHSSHNKPKSTQHNDHDPLMVGFNFSQNSINKTFTANINVEYLYNSAEFDHGTAIGVSLLADDISGNGSESDIFAGFEISHKVAFNQPISPYIGVGLFGGDQEEDCTLTNLQIHYDEECPVEYIFDVYPEVGLQAWLGDSVRIQSFARYNITTSDINPTYWSYGFGLSVR
jgi:hypothetical protein